MNNSRGFILPSGMTLYIALGAALIIGVLGIALKVKSAQLEAKTAQHDKFVSDVKVVGEMQEAETKRINEKHADIVKEKDHENLVAHTKLADSAKRLRDNRRSSGGILSNFAAPANRDHLVCFSRNDFDRAFEQFDSGLSVIAEESDKRAIDLATGREWIKALN